MHDAWADSISDKWPRIVKKVGSLSQAAASQKFVSRKKMIPRLTMGLPLQLAVDSEPLIKFLEASPKSKSARAESIEGIASLSESVAATFLDASPTELGVEVPGVAKARLLGGFSAILVANQIRRVVKHGTDQQFERIYRSLDVLGRIRYEDDGGENVLLNQWLSAEVPLMLGLRLPEVKHFRKLAKLGAANLSQNLKMHLDADGWPARNCLELFPTLVASWMRSLSAIQQLGLKLDKTASSQAAWLAEQFVRLLGPGKLPLFGGETYGKVDEKFTLDLLNTIDDPDGWAAAREAKVVPAGRSKTKPAADLNDPCCVSEWASSAILKSSWKSASPFLAVDFGQPNSRFEIGAKNLLISGQSKISVRDDNQEVILDPAGFDVTCEIHDDKVSYLELEMTASGLKFYRQLLLGRKDKFLLVADGVHKSGSGEIEWSLDLPLAPGVNIVPENGTREMYLNCGGIQSLVLPLALPEWTNQRGQGKLVERVEDGRTFLSATASATLREHGGGLYFPMFFDLSPKRSRLKRTWRRLTVAESLKIVRPETAGAFRVQVDRDQWVFYRALGSVGNRTFLGQNFAGDFFAGRFKANGEVDELVQVQ